MKKIEKHSALIVVALFVAITMAVLMYQRAVDTVVPVQSDDVLVFSFEKPDWFAGHHKKSAIDEYILGQYCDIRESAVEFQEEFPDSASLPFRYAVELTRTVTGDYESILLEDYRYTGGAHGNTLYVFYNFKNGQSILLEDYLKSVGSSEESFLGIVNTALLRDGHTVIETFAETPWQIQAKDESAPLGIKLLFPPYAVASYAEGTIIYSF